MTIVCATHFTPSSLDAVRVATALAARTGKKLHLVAVMPVGSPQEIDQASKTALQDDAIAAREFQVDVSTTVLHGRLEQQLSKYCRDVGAQLLVLGDTSSSMSPLFASPIDRISEDVPVPMLVVKSRLPFIPWANGEGPLKVLLALDHSWNASVTRVWLQQLSAFGPLDVLATHIWSPAEEARRLHIDKPTDEMTAMWAEKLERATLAGMRGLPENVKLQVQLEIGRGHIGRLLLDIANRQQRDVLVMGTHAHGILSRLTSVTHEVLAEGAQSVALIPQVVTKVSPRQSKTIAIEARH